MSSEDDARQRKQEYLKREIMDQAYDCEAFAAYLTSIKRILLLSSL